MGGGDKRIPLLYMYMHVNTCNSTNVTGYGGVGRGGGRMNVYSATVQYMNMACP